MRKGYDMRHIWFWLGIILGILCTIGVLCLSVFLLRAYRRRKKAKRQETRTALDWETSPLPDPEEMDFQAFYILLSQHGRYTRTQAKRLYELSMYETTEGEAIPQGEEALDDYDAEIEAEMIIEESMEKGA